MLYFYLVDKQEQADVKQTSSVKAALMRLGLDSSRLSLNIAADLDIWNDALTGLIYAECRLSHLIKVIFHNLG